MQTSSKPSTGLPMEWNAQGTPFAAGAVRFGKDLQDLRQIEGVLLDLRYATQDNFMHRDLYAGFGYAFLHQAAFTQFQQAAQLLQARVPGYKFVVFDALRPRSVQRQMFDYLAGTALQAYVADPAEGSLHNFGFAIDLTLQDAKGQWVDMGTEFDDFSELAQPKLEEQLLHQGRLTKTQIQNRALLKGIMHDAGFQQLPHEWWHFNARPANEVRGHFAIFE